MMLCYRTIRLRREEYDRALRNLHNRWSFELDVTEWARWLVGRTTTLTEIKP